MSGLGKQQTLFAMTIPVALAQAGLARMRRPAGDLKDPPRVLFLAMAVLVSACGAGPLDVVDNRLMRGLVAHWALDESTGSRALDSSGNGHDGTITGATWIPGQSGGAALHFEQGDEVQVPSFPQATVDWTVALWARPTAGDFGDMYITLVSTEEVFTGGWELNVKLTSSDRFFQFGYYLGPGNSDYYTYDCSCLVPDQWTHIAAVVRGNEGTLSFYRDSLFQGRAVAPSSAKPGPIHPGSATLYMGRWSMADRLFKGDLDDIVVYDRALSDAEVSALARPATANGL